jgi:hypothetical protein
MGPAPVTGRSSCCRRTVTTPLPDRPRARCRTVFAPPLDDHRAAARQAPRRRQKVPALPPERSLRRRPNGPCAISRIVPAPPPEGPLCRLLPDATPAPRVQIECFCSLDFPAGGPPVAPSMAVLPSTPGTGHPCTGHSASGLCRCWLSTPTPITGQHRVPSLAWLITGPFLGARRHQHDATWSARGLRRRPLNLFQHFSILAPCTRFVFFLLYSYLSRSQL